jgi:hypothetical protein
LFLLCLNYNPIIVDVKNNSNNFLQIILNIILQVFLL